MKILAALAFTIASSSAFAVDLPITSLKTKTNFKSKLSEIPREAGTDYNFEGIVKLNNCSGSLVILNGMPTSAKAIVMTNGHCLGLPGGQFLKPGQVMVNSPVNRAMKIFKTLKDLKPIQATKILYATMTDTDVAYYELNQSYEQIKRAYDIDPLELDVNRPRIGNKMEIISGYWDVGWRCSIDAFVPKMKEAAWTWVDSIRYTSTCTTMGGTSGSPIIAAGERRVIGINNTSNESGEKCTMNNPCEVGNDGQVVTRKGVRYGQQVYPLYTCLTPSFDIDLSIPGCDLPK